jgi:hypothetical protein
VEQLKGASQLVSTYPFLTLEGNIYSPLSLVFQNKLFSMKRKYTTLGGIADT